MTAKEFNEKYSSYLEKGHYGAEGHDNAEFLNWLDEKFQKFITYPGFRFTQIKSKFQWGRFYCEGVPQEEVREVEERIEQDLK